MPNLVISIFENEREAERGRDHLLSVDRERTFDIEDMITMEKTETGNLRFHHLTHFTLGGAVGGAFLGGLIGALLFNPVLIAAGLFVGALIGLVAGSSSQIGIIPATISNQANNLIPGEAALCVQTSINPNLVANELNRFKGAAFRTSICTLHDGFAQCMPSGPIEPGLAVP